MIMASRVNTKFVIILSALLVLVGVGVGGAYYVFRMRSGEHYVSLGDKAMQDGKVEVADKWYERAVGKEQFNVEWLKKWRSAREKVVPANQNEYVQAYRMYHGILRNLAQAQKTNVEAHRDYLEMIYQECAFSGSRGSWDFLVNSAEEALNYFQTDPENPAPPPLRRYRGLALAEITASDPNLPKDRIDLARQDLEAVLKADPKDGWAANALAVWHRVAAQRARGAGDDGDAKLHTERSRAVLDQFTAANPGDPIGLLSILTADLLIVDQLNDPLKSPGDNVRARLAAVEALAPRIPALIEAAKRTDGIASHAVNQIAALAPQIDTKNGRDLALSFINDLLAKEPRNMDYLLISAQLVAQSQPPDLAGVISAYQKVIELPDKPVSLEGLRLLSMRNRARFAQASASLQAAADAKEEVDRKKLFDAARNYRNEFARNVPEDAPELLFIDGKAALIDNPPNIPKSRSLLAKFLKSPGDAVPPVVLEASVLMAEVGMRSTPPEPGLARENLMRVIAARPGSVEIRAMLARVERQLQNYDSALSQLKIILELDPENAAARADLQTLTALTSPSTDIKIDDPITKVLVEAERLSIGSGNKLGDEPAALALIERNLETHNHNPRLIMALALGRFRQGDKDAAKKVLELGLQKNPDESKPEVATLKEFDRRIRAADTLEGTLAFIKASQVPDLDRQLLLHATYVEFKKPEEAAAALAEAEKISPDHPRVIDLRFQATLMATPPDLARAGELTEKAARLNLDQADGETFRARLQIAQKSYREAAGTLSRAVERGNAPAGVYRLLGLVQSELGRTQDAMASFRRAIDLVPTDLGTIKMYLGVLVKAGEITEAVAVARKSQGVARNDAEFLNLWLALEARAGRTDFALERREDLFKRNPKNRDNAAALAEICIDQKAWDRARQLIDQLRADKDELRVAVIDARWHADRGDIEQAKRILRDHIGKLEDGPDKLNAYVTFGQFLLQRGHQQQGVAAIRQAEAFQDPKTMPVTLMLGDVQISAGLFADAEQTYRKILDAKVPDPDLKLRKRLIEALNQQQKYTDAEVVFKELGAAAESDVEMLAQHASTAKGLGNTQQARDILDDAIRKFPDEPMPYLRRARLLSQDPSLKNDAMADLATAIRLRPSFWQALRTRAMLQLAEGKTDEGMRDLKEAVDRNPGMDDLRLEYLDYLIRFGRENEAVDAADAAIATRPNDARLITQFAAAFGRAGRWGRAARYDKMLWDQLRNEPAALTYCNSLLSSTPPGLTEADAVLASSELKTDQSWRLLMARAVVRKKQGKDQAARADLMDSFSLIGADGMSVLTWCEDIRSLYPSVDERLNILNSVRVPPLIEDWVILGRGRIALEDKRNIDEGIKSLRALRERVQDNNLRCLVQVNISAALVRQEKWQESLDEIRLGLQFCPNNSMLANNAAAIMSQSLNKPNEALPFAERAVAADPMNYDYMDTLAVTHWALNDKPQAIRRMGDALRLARTEADKAQTLLKLAGWKLQAGDSTGAKALLDLLREMTTDNPALRDSIKTPLEKLITDLNAVSPK
jgi:tetratricopeptide (TPR) repeat protein